MMGFAEPTPYYGTTVTITSNVNVSGTTATAWAEAPRTRVFVVYDTHASYPDPPQDPFERVETLFSRRRRLSLEAIERYRRDARKFRLRVVSQWRRAVHVARVCAQSERWRVLVS